MLQQLEENIEKKNEYEEDVEIVRRSPEAMKEYLVYDEKIDVMAERGWPPSMDSFVVLLKTSKMKELAVKVLEELEMDWYESGYESNDSYQSISERCPPW